ncbi:hypothetical protein C8F01DRAFT_1019945 [Mycena amicta]|nr:hypothetical protein C8F01DRAFT_1019945 [Mycena amicta]
MSHRSHSNKHALPNNPLYIDFLRSDGDRRTWPSHTTEVVDDEGNVNFMRAVPLDEPLAVKWRTGVGDAIAMHFNYPERESHRHVLRSFPSGYCMYDHHKGKQAAPRHDVYLFGCGSRFRSVPEFIPHAIWLMGDQNEQCKCKYCTKKPQREITMAMSDLIRTSQSPGPSASRPQRVPHARSRLPERLRDKEPPPRAVIQNAVPDISPHIQESAVMINERYNDLRAVTCSVKPDRVPRYFREGELVWCALDVPIQGPNGVAISCWPGIVDKYNLRQIPMVQGGQSPPEHHLYTVQLLATSRTCTLLDTKVIPYQSYMLFDGIFTEMGTRPVDQWHDLDDPTLSSFDPWPEPPNPPPSWDACLSPYAMALQIAAHITDYWSVTDDWEAKIQAPQSASHGSALSLASAIERAGANNARQNKTSQFRFQGLWWGGERIWVDDLVRLKIPRSCLAPGGAPNLFAASGPGKENAAAIRDRDLDPADFGGASRAVFMRIDSLFLLEGKPRELRAAGMLYELADHDWHDPNVPHLPDGVPAKPQPAPWNTSEKQIPMSPKGHKFRPIVSTGSEVAVSLSLLAGRYYPLLLQHPLILPQLATIDTKENTQMQSFAHLWSLEGLFPGVSNSVDPWVYKANRETLMKDAFKAARKSIDEHVRLQNSEADSAVPMEVE